MNFVCVLGRASSHPSDRMCAFECVHTGTHPLPGVQQAVHAELDAEIDLVNLNVTPNYCQHRHLHQLIDCVL